MENVLEEYADSPIRIVSQVGKHKAATVVSTVGQDARARPNPMQFYYLYFTGENTWGGVGKWWPR